MLFLPAWLHLEVLVTWAAGLRANTEEQQALQAPKREQGEENHSVTCLGLNSLLTETEQNLFQLPAKPQGPHFPAASARDKTRE